MALVRPAVEGWRRTWDATVAEQTRQTAAVLEALGNGGGSHLHGAEVLQAPPAPNPAVGNVRPADGPRHLAPRDPMIPGS